MELDSNYGITNLFISKEQIVKEISEMMKSSAPAVIGNDCACDWAQNPIPKQNNSNVIAFFISGYVFYLFSILEIIINRSLKLLRLSELFVKALPMQYLLNPERFMRNSLKMSRAGDGTLPSRFNSMMAVLSSLSRPSLFR